MKAVLSVFSKTMTNNFPFSRVWKAVFTVEERSSNKNGREEINSSCIEEKYNDLNPRKLIHLYGTLQKQVFLKLVSPLFVREYVRDVIKQHSNS